MRRKSKSSKDYSSPELTKIRRRFDRKQREIFDHVWFMYEKNQNWPLTRSIHSKFGKKAVHELLGRMSGDLVSEVSEGSRGTVYQLSVLGILLTQQGSRYFKLIVRYFEFLRSQYLNDPEKLEFDDREIAESLELNAEECCELGRIVWVGQLSSGGGRGNDKWNIRVPDGIEDLPVKGSLVAVVEKLLLQSFDSDKSVFIKDRQPPIESGSNMPNQSNQSSISTIDALRRRYQVFVSSTYEDLKDERQHVIQALLETKCIPLGMELFPAASVEQWELIKRIIDECDYYVVIVAGRYGSVSKTGVGYTEMEFEYANSIGKPVIGFYHSNIDELAGSKLEKTDKGRKRLKQFTEKVRLKLCRSWSSPAELGSAVKSAIISELEFNPRPGWVRADSVGSTETTEKLKQRIADLEEQLKRKKARTRPKYPDGSEQFKFTVGIRHEFKEGENILGFETKIPTKRFEQQIGLSWDEILLALSDGLQPGRVLGELTYLLVDSLREKVQPTVASILSESDPEFSCIVSDEDMQRVLKTLMARKLVKMFSNRYSEWRDPDWRFTPKGLQYLAELQAVRMNEGDRSL